MSDLQTLHGEAMELVDEALLARRRGAPHQVEHLFRAALEKECDALAVLELAGPVEPTASVLYRSAASLAMDCGEWRKAEQLASRGLAGDPPPAIADELREILARLRHSGQPDQSGVAEPTVSDGPVRVLVVDDEAAAQLAELLERSPAPAGQVRLVADPAETMAAALPRLLDRSYDVAVIDMVMPNPSGDDGLAGFDALSLVHDASPDTRVVMLAGRFEAGTAAKLLAAGADAFLERDNRFLERLPVHVWAAAARRRSDRARCAWQERQAHQLLAALAEVSELAVDGLAGSDEEPTDPSVLLRQIAAVAQRAAQQR